MANTIVGVVFFFSLLTTWMTPQKNLFHCWDSIFRIIHNFNMKTMHPYYAISLEY